MDCGLCGIETARVRLTATDADSRVLDSTTLCCDCADLCGLNVGKNALPPLVSEDKWWVGVQCEDESHVYRSVRANTRTQAEAAALVRLHRDGMRPSRVVSCEVQK